MATLSLRLKALETVRDRPMKDVEAMTDAELLAILGLDHQPTDEELLEIVMEGRRDATT